VSKVNVLEACNAAMAHELENDPNVLLLGADVGTAGGIFRATRGLQQRFGAQRVIDTPLDEKGIVAHAVGMGLYGARPIVEIQFSGFIHDAFEQIMFCGSKYRWLTGGEYSVPMTIRAPSFGGIKGGFWHSQSPEAYFVHGGGIKIVAPSTVDDAYRLLLAAIRDPDPVLVLEPVPLYRALSAELDQDGIAARIGEARTVRPGDDVTLVTYGPMVHVATRVADSMAAAGTSVEVIDLRTIVPVDLSAVVTSVERTGRLVVAHEASRSLGFGSELAALVGEHAFGYLHAPIERVAAPDLPYSFSTGDEYYRPGAERLTSAIRRAVEFAF
jgi:pyruvate dehydrogenase E1 component beta subunit